jgi:hypothetical protein
MSVTPMLGDWEIPRIAFLRTEEARKLAVHGVPGRTGAVYQDLGAEAAVIELAGSVFTEEERSAFFEDVRSRFAEGEPLTFVADILTATDIQYVLIDSLVFEERAERAGELSYRMRLRQSPPPPPPPDPFGAIDSGLLDAASGFADAIGDAMDALDALSNIPDFSDPSALLGGTTDEALAAMNRIGEIGSRLQSLFGSS